MFSYIYLFIILANLNIDYRLKTTAIVESLKFENDEFIITIAGYFASRK